MPKYFLGTQFPCSSPVLTERQVVRNRLNIASLELRSISIELGALAGTYKVPYIPAPKLPLRGNVLIHPANGAP